MFSTLIIVLPIFALAGFLLIDFGAVNFVPVLVQPGRRSADDHRLCRHPGWPHMGGPAADLEIDEKHRRRRRYRYYPDWKAGSALSRSHRPRRSLVMGPIKGEQDV
jgi:hypothetical protein